jgi:hypothetical protein
MLYIENWVSMSKFVKPRGGYDIVSFEITDICV